MRTLHIVDRTLHSGTLHKPLTLALQEGREVDDYEKAGAIKRMDNERDSLCAFHLRIATFDSGWANAAAQQEAPPTKDGGINPKGWCNQLTG